MRESRYPTWAFGALLQAAILSSALACRPAPPVVPPATITGSVHVPDDATTPIEGRAVTAVNLVTGERHMTATSPSGSFSFKVTPGRYRIDVSLRDGELIVKHPDALDVAPRDGARAEVVIAPSRVARPRFRAPRGDDGLGAGVA